MALREFSDANGRAWQVWETHPSPPTAAEGTALEKFLSSRHKDGTSYPTVRQQFASGWLTFASGDERRRLAPIPDAWDQSGIDGLRQYLSSSTPIEKR